MNKSIICMLIVFCVLSAVYACATISTTTKLPQHENGLMRTTYEDELDQSMTEFEGALPIGGYSIHADTIINISIAQSFMPQKEVVTRIQLYMARNITATQPCSLALRESLTGITIAAARLDASSFIVYDPEIQHLEWVEFDIPDVWINTNTTYYMVLYTANVTDNYYWIGGNSSNQYPDGSAYISMNDGQTWDAYIDADGCFKTYGLEETFLNIIYEPPEFPNFYSSGTWKIKNIGNATAWDIVCSLTFKGGILGRINKTFTATIDTLEVDEEQILTFHGLIFGLGAVTITGHAHAANVRDILITQQGFILLFYIILR